MKPEEKYDWTRFVKRITVSAPVSEIYFAWATREGLERWFLRKAAFRSPSGELIEKNKGVSSGDTYEWMWHGWNDDTVEHGKILEANGKDHLRFVFGKEGIVTIDILSESNETVVELIQESIPDDETHKVRYHLGCSTGWTFYLANLKSILEGGIDLRNKNPEIKSVVNS